MLLDFKSKWFRLYCRAVVESETDGAHDYIRDAFVAINDRVHDPDLGESEREALFAATRYLNLILRVETPRAW